jgi:5-hydroxyisourate hydrolase
MSSISTHVLDISKGRPAVGVAVELDVRTSKAGIESWELLGKGETDADGRVRSLIHGGGSLVQATYRLTFATGSYFSAQGIDSFYPSVTIIFQIRDASQHYHVPLLLSPYGYSTYRGT